MNFKALIVSGTYRYENVKAEEKLKGRMVL
jgi:hypothetical protein